MTSPRENWDVFIRCRDCGWESKRKGDYSCEVIETKRGRGRMVLIGVPQDCPRCHSLHVVEGKSDG